MTYTKELLQRMKALEADHRRLTDECERLSRLVARQWRQLITVSEAYTRLARAKERYRGVPVV